LGTHEDHRPDQADRGAAKDPQTRAGPPLVDLCTCICFADVENVSIEEGEARESPVEEGEL